MLLPTLNRARDKAKAIACVNQLNQLGKSVDFYASDYNDFFPARTSLTKPLYMLYQNKYVKKSLLLCPGAAVHGLRYGYSGPEGPILENDYLFNRRLGGAITASYPDAAAMKRTMLKSPSIGIMTMDGRVAIGGIMEWYGYGTPPQYVLYFQQPLGTIAFWDTVRHGGVVNVLFADGHVAVIRDKAEFQEKYQYKGGKNITGNWINI